MGSSGSIFNSHNSNILEKPEVYFVLGGPGCGKGTQCINMVNHYKFIHLSAGDLLRAEQETKGPDAQEIQQSIKEGKLVSGQLTVRLIRKAIAKNGNRRYLIDGFPRSKDNFEAWKKIMKDDISLKELLFFECSQEQMTSRIMSRAKSSGRADDNPQTIKKRFETYKQETLPLIQEFRHLGKCITIDANKGKQEVYQILKQQLGSNNIFPPKPVQVFFVLGGPGSGKGTQCANLVVDYGFKHLSTGDLLRQAVKQGTKQGQQINQLMKQGKLVSTTLLIALIKNAIFKTNYNKRILLDGFPRNNQNDEVWKELMTNESIVRGLIYLKCSEEVMEQRLLLRGKTSGRADDNIDTIKKRFKTFTEDTQPVVERYDKLGIVITIDAQKQPKEVYQQLKIKLEGFNVCPKVKDYDNRPQVIFILGGPGSGKGTQCEQMIKQFGFGHLSTGDLLRQEQAKNGLIADNIIELMKQGKLVGSQILVSLIRKAIEEKGWKGIYLLDGFPRSFENIAAWQQDIGSEINIRNLIYFQCSQAVMQQRLKQRGKTSGRADDNPQTIKKRFVTFQKETAPIVSKYQKNGIVLKVNAEKSKEQVYNDLKEVLIQNGYKPQ